MALFDNDSSVTIRSRGSAECVGTGRAGGNGGGRSWDGGSLGVFDGIVFRHCFGHAGIEI